MQPPVSTTLFINALEMPIHIGWTDNERLHPQSIFLDIELRFPKTPKACETDQLEDTVCYDSMIRTIREKTHQRHFKLVEHLASEIYRIVQTGLPEKTLAKIKIKKMPAISGLTDGVCFHYGDF